KAVAGSRPCHRWPVVASATTIGDVTERSARSSAARWGLLCGPHGVGVAIDLQPRNSEPRNAVPVDGSLPREQLFERQLVATASLLNAECAAANGRNDNRLAPHDPTLCVWRRQVEGPEADRRERLRGLNDLSSAHFIQADCIG